MEKKIEHYIHLYPGCRIETVDGPGVNLGHYWPDVWLKEGRIEPNGVVVGFPKQTKIGKHSAFGPPYKIVIMNYNQCVLRPTPLTEMTYSHQCELVKLRSAVFLAVDPLPMQNSFGFRFTFEYSSNRRRREDTISFSDLNQEQTLFLLQHGYDLFRIGEMKLNPTKHAKAKRTVKKAVRASSKKKNARNKGHK
jgi:hypothetical protein